MPEPRRAEPDFEVIARRLVRRKDVTLGSGRRGFGSDALQVGGRIFAMARRDGLVLKLPAARVTELVDSGAGTAFDAGKGRPMKEWVVVREADVTSGLALAQEALAFVRGQLQSR
jgi:hypothetical protein